MTTKNIKLNLIDKIVSAFNPVAGAQRLRSKMFLSAFSHDGASTTRKALKTFLPNLFSSDQDDLPEQRPLKARSRQLYRNAPIARGAINVNTVNVVGNGLKLQSRLDYKSLGMSEDEAAEMQKKIEKEFSLFAENKFSDARGLQNFYELQELVFKNTLMSGEVVCLLPNIKRKNFKYDLSVQVLESDFLDTPINQVSASTFSGIENNEFGEPIYYYIQKKHPGDFYSFGGAYEKIRRYGERSGRLQVLHCYFIERPGQRRGIPFLAPVIEPLKQLSRYSDAELMASVIQSMFTAFITNPENNTAVKGINDDQTDADEIGLGNGALFELNPGQKIETAQPNRPNSHFEGFFDSYISLIGSSLGTPHEVLKMRYQNSYSASKAALLEAWKFFKQRRGWLVNNFCKPIYQEFFIEAVMKGYIDAPNFFDSQEIREAYMRAQWIGQGRGMIDPNRETTAMIKRVEAGLSSKAEEIAESRGADYDMVIEQRAREIQKEKDLKIIPEENSNDTNSN